VAQNSPVRDLHLYVGVLGGVIGFAAIFPYIASILRRDSRPNVVSYALWSLLIGVSIWAQVDSGASWSLIFMVGDLLSVLAVVALCAVGYGYGRYGRIEWVCTALAIAAVVLWQLTDEPVLAIVLALAADVLAAAPTIVKTWRDPWSETPWTWLAVALGAALGVASTTIFDFANLLFPIGVFFINFAIGLVALVGRRRMPRPKHFDYPTV
jgi:hypothetical protein